MKEACYKALYPEWKVSWKHVSLKKSNKKPELHVDFSSFVNEAPQVDQSLVSISHEGDYVIANVMFVLSSEIKSDQTAKC